MRTAITWVSVIVVVAVVGCTSSGREAKPTTTVRDLRGQRLELPRTGGCGDAFFWAATDSGDVAVTVLVDTEDRPSDRPTKLTASLPSDLASVRVLRGTDVPRNFCTDVIDSDSQPRSASRAAAGDLTIVLDPAPTPPVLCGRTSVEGRMELVRLIADDRTAFAPISVRTNSIGCVDG
jgi:hypothetical protein